MSERQKVIYAILASMLVHLLAVLVLALWSVQHASEIARALPDLRQLTVTIMPPRPQPKAAPAPPPAAAAAVVAPTPVPIPANRPVLDSDGLTKSTKAPAHPLFQSDANMVAGTMLPGTGNIPLPSELGPREKFMDFANQASSFGKGESPSVPLPPRRAAPPAQPAKAAQPSQSMPEQTPSAVTQVQSSPAPLAKETPAPRPQPRAIPTPGPNMIALGTPTPPPPPPAPPAQMARLTLRGSADMAPLSRAPASRPKPPAPPMPEPGTQRELDRTRINGGITERGAPGVDAGETAYGRYHRKLSTLIGSRWQLYLQEHPKDVGEVTILVQLYPNGKVAGTRVIANHAMDDLADLSTRAVLESDLPPVPDELAPTLRDGKFEITFNFDVYDPSNDAPGR